MAPGKIGPIKGPAFNGTGTLGKKDCAQLAVPDARQVDHLTPNWLQKARAIICVHLRPDNVSIDHTSLLLKGPLHSGDKAYQAKNFWPLDSALSLVLEPIDLSLFAFPPNSLSSSPLDSSALAYQFADGNTIVPPDTLATLGITGFCLRAHLFPTHPQWIKISISLLPLSADALLLQHPLAVSPAFPGISLDAGGAIHLGPSAAEIFPAIHFGSPIAPALVTQTPWERAIGHPPTGRLNFSVFSFLRTAIKPVNVKLDKLAAAWAELKDSGEQALKFKQPDHLWPEPRAVSDGSEGTTLFSPIFSYLFLLWLLFCPPPSPLVCFSFLFFSPSFPSFFLVFSRVLFAPPPFSFL